MAKASKVVINKELLSLVAAATAGGSVYYLTKDEAKPFLDHKPPLVEVNTNMLQDGKAAARVTADGMALVGAGEASQAPTSNGAATSPYALIKGAVLPPSKRGVGLRGGGAPKQYPFDTMEIGDSFFVPVSEKHPDPVKTLGSTVSSANMRFSEKTGEMKMVNRTKRGPDRKALVENGQKVKETVEVPVHKPTRKFAIRSVEAGKTYGNFIAPADGALIARVPIE